MDISVAFLYVAKSHAKGTAGLVSVKVFETITKLLRAFSSIVEKRCVLQLTLFPCVKVECFKVTGYIEHKW